MRRRVTLIALLSTITIAPIIAQTSVAVQIVAMVVDTDLNVRPVPRHAVTLRPASGEGTRAVTGLDGKVIVALQPGEYTLESERPLEFQGKSYRWQQRVVVLAGQPQTIELSNDNAVVEATTAAPPTSVDLPSLFRRWQGSVVTVWSDTGHGSGFIVDSQGLILTNQHVVGVSNYVAVQFDEKTKVPAQIVAKSPERDVAVLRINATYLAQHEPVNLAFSGASNPPVVEGEQVFTIGSPLNQRKAMTSGIVSRVEAKAIISDININHGNSGGPLFTTGGAVIGITTFADISDQGGPGISGIVRIDEARDLIETARESLLQPPPPEGTLPVEPLQAYPVDALKAAVISRQLRAADYLFAAGDFDVTVVTPVLTYGTEFAQEQASLKEREKRNKNAQSEQSAMETTLSQFKNWAEYVGEYQPVIFIEARPKLVEGFWSGLNRGLSAAQGIYAGPAQMHFKSDFYKMRLLCDGKEVQPIHPGKIEHRVSVSNAAVKVNDASYEGFYAFAPDAIGPHCATVQIDFFTEKEPEKAQSKTLARKLVQRIWDDFEPYRTAVGRP